MLRLSEEFRYAEVLLDGLEEQLYHPSLFGETCDELHGTLSRCRGARSRPLSGLTASPQAASTRRSRYSPCQNRAFYQRVKAGSLHGL